MSFVKMNISASFMIIAILLIRKHTVNKLPHGLFGFLWSLAILRLSIPFSIRGNFSFYNLFYHFEDGITENIYYQRVAAFLQSKTLNFTNNPNTMRLIFLIWFIGFLLLSLYFIINFRKGKIWIANAQTWEKPIKITEWVTSQNIHRFITLKKSPDILSPISYGILKPGIIFPENMDFITEDALKQMVIHECMHIKYFHSLWKLISVVILCLYWFNPCIWFLYTYIHRDMEIFCDQKVIHKLGASTKESYAKNLIYMAEKNMCESITYNGFNKNALVERVVAIMKFKKASVFALAFAVTLPIGIASVFATTNNILSQKEIAGLEDVVVETAEENLDIPVQSIEVISLKLKTKNIFSYIVNDQERTRSIKIDNYKYKDYGNIPPKTINMSVKNNGYTFKGTLTQTGYRYIDKKDKYIGYYSGTLYRSGAVKKPWALPKPTNFFEKKVGQKISPESYAFPRTRLRLVRAESRVITFTGKKAGRRRRLLP